MRAVLKRKGRREPSVALLYLKDCNNNQSLASPRIFNTIARAALSSQGSSASAERLFSDLGRLEGRQRQTMLSGTLEMTETIRVFVQSRLQDCICPQRGLLHPRGAAFKDLVTTFASQVVNLQKKSS